MFKPQNKQPVNQIPLMPNPLTAEQISSYVERFNLLLSVAGFITFDQRFAVTFKNKVNNLQTENLKILAIINPNLAQGLALNTQPNLDITAPRIRQIKRALNPDELDLVDLASQIIFYLAAYMQEDQKVQDSFIKWVDRQKRDTSFFKMG